MNRQLAVAAALVFAVALPACGGAEDSSSFDAAAAPATETSTKAESGGSAAIEIVNIAFKPTSMKVLRGTEVTWTSADANVRHTATSGVPGERAVPGVSEGAPAKPDGVFDGDLPDAGSAFSFTFDEAGTYAYFCEIHPSMTAEIVVE